MDPLQSNEKEKDESTLENLTKQSVIIVSDTGEVHLQLEGSHITSTETESSSLNYKEKKNVKFQDKIGEPKALMSENIPRDFKEIEEKQKIDIETVLAVAESNDKETEKQEVVKKVKWVSKESKESMNIIKPLDRRELKQIDQGNKEIAERFQQIMEMFENFSKNLEILDLETTQEQNLSGGVRVSTTKRKRPKCSNSIDNIKRQRKDLEKQAKAEFKINTIEDYLRQQATRQTLMKPLQTEPPLITLTIESQPFTSSISTNTSLCDFTPVTAPRPCQNFGSQTLGSAHYSLNDLSLLEVSSITSQSEALNSLNNYAQPENALDSPKQLQIPSTPTKSLKVGGNQESIATSITERNELSQVVVQQSSHENVHTIHIETNSVPSASDLRRPPFCQRLGTIIGDFCAATLLCLQVNRDCIFCLGFFIAFVVSASFLTAFFYHTLSVSPYLWQTEGDTMKL